MERERLRKIEEEKDRQVREKREAEKRQYQEVIEHKQRKQQLRDSIEYLLTLKQQSKEIRRQEKTEREVCVMGCLFHVRDNEILFLFDLDTVDSIHALHRTTKYR